MWRVVQIFDSIGKATVVKDEVARILVSVSPNHDELSPAFYNVEDF